MTNGNSSIGLVAMAAMTKPGGDKNGITNGEHPLLVVVPAKVQFSFAIGGNSSQLNIYVLICSQLALD